VSDAARFVVSETLAGSRVDRVVAVLGDMSRSASRDLVAQGLVTVDGSPAVPSQRLDAGAVVVFSPPPPPARLTAAPVPFTVVAEDAAVIVVDKPPGVVVHPGAGHRDDTLVNGLVYRFPELSALGKESRWGLVHRLDRDTSGLLLVGRSAETHRALQRALRRREIRRTYLALAHGSVDAATGTVEAPIGRDPRHPTRMAVTAAGRAARTHYRRLAWWDEATLLEVTLDTGRTHQIRVHLASIGAPLVGDPVYGRRTLPAAEPGRVWLHAWRLRFPHPVEDRTVEVEAPLPGDLVASLDRLGSPRGGEIPVPG
jgi:23S rRNA pseudouridine1911/1915/1917 synthase